MLFDFIKSVLSNISPLSLKGDDKSNFGMDDSDTEWDGQATGAGHESDLTQFQSMDTADHQEAGSFSRFIDFVADRMGIGSSAEDVDSNLDSITNNLVATAMEEPEQHVREGAPTVTMEKESGDELQEDDEFVSFDIQDDPVILGMNEDFAQQDSVQDFIQRTRTDLDLLSLQNNDFRFYDDLPSIHIMTDSEEEVHQSSLQDNLPFATNGNHDFDDIIITDFSGAGQAQAWYNQEINFVLKKPSNDSFGLGSLASDEISFSDLHSNGIMSLDSVNHTSETLKHGSIANDTGQNVSLDSTDILEMGNNIIITGNDSDFINFEDSGWTRLASEDDIPAGIVPQEGYDIYVHDSGAIVQVEHLITTNYDDPGSV